MGPADDIDAEEGSSQLRLEGGGLCVTGRDRGGWVGLGSIFLLGLGLRLRVRVMVRVRVRVRVRVKA